LAELNPRYWQWRELWRCIAADPEAYREEGRRGMKQRGDERLRRSIMLL